MITRTVLFIGALTLVGSANAALHDRGSGLIYDDVLNVTWLQDANYSVTQNRANSNQGDVNGIMNWFDANTWVANLNYVDTVRNITWDDWRLPNALPLDSSCSNQSPDIGESSGFGCTGNEMGHLFYVDLGGVADQNIMTTHSANFDLFTNWQQNWASGESVFYWTSTYYTGPSGNKAWAFTFKNGSPAPLFVGEEQHAWAVRDGDVAAIPEPETYGMFLAGLGLLAVLVRSNKYRQ